MLWKFFLVYTALMTLAAILGANDILGIDMAVVWGTVTWVRSTFKERNGRTFTLKEKAAVIVGFIAIDLLLQFVIGHVRYRTDPNRADQVSDYVSMFGVVHAIVIALTVLIAETAKPADKHAEPSKEGANQG